MTNAIETVGFLILLGMVPVWFILVSWLFRRLRNYHPQTYEAMGSPSLFWNNSMRNNWLFMRFLFSAKSKQLGDDAVASVTRSMRLFSIVYMTLFVGLFMIFLSRIISQP